MKTLHEALRFFQKYANRTFEFWNADKDHKVGKRLAAMAGDLTGYDHDLDAAFLLLDEPQPVWLVGSWGRRNHADDTVFVADSVWTTEEGANAEYTRKTGGAWAWVIFKTHADQDFIDWEDVTP